MKRVLAGLWLFAMYEILFATSLRVSGMSVLESVLIPPCGLACVVVTVVSIYVFFIVDLDP